jgi:hypothetical protein
LQRSFAVDSQHAEEPSPAIVQEILTGLGKVKKEGSSGFRVGEFCCIPRGAMG